MDPDIAGDQDGRNRGPGHRRGATPRDGRNAGDRDAGDIGQLTRLPGHTSRRSNSRSSSSDRQQRRARAPGRRPSSRIRSARLRLARRCGARLPAAVPGRARAQRRRRSPGPPGRARLLDLGATARYHSRRSPPRLVLARRSSLVGAAAPRRSPSAPSTSTPSIRSNRLRQRRTLRNWIS